MLPTIELKAPPLDDLHVEESREPAPHARSGEAEPITRWSERYTPAFRDLVARPSEIAPMIGGKEIAAWPEPSMVLVVDDFEANRRSVSRNLRLQGYTAVVAENGRRA